MSKLINIAEDLTDDGIAKLKIGQVLRFQGKERVTELKVIKKHLKKRELWVREIVTFTPEELDGTVKVVEK